MAGGDPRGIARLMKFPERFDSPMDALLAREHLAPDAHVRHLPFGDDRPRDRDGPLGVVCGFADPPLTFLVADVSRNDRPGNSFEASDAMRIPTLHVLTRQHLRLLADGITGRDALQAAKDAIGGRERHVAPIAAK